MDRNAVEVMCRVAQALATVKGIARSMDDGSYRIAREQIGNCLEEMAKYCDTSPLRLMGGDVESIMRNYEHWEINLQEN
jgi:hypothetical protein